MATIAPPPPPPPPPPSSNKSSGSSAPGKSSTTNGNSQKPPPPPSSPPQQRTFFDISQLPSLKDGMTMEEESTKRRKTCRFIEEAGRILKLPRVAISTAMVFFHRFYAKHSFVTHDRFEVAVATLVLAAKTEESPKKLNSVLLECHKLKQRGMQAGRIQQKSTSAAGGSSPPPASSSSKDATLDPKGEEFAKLKERILLLERVILHTIGFELSIDHPYKFLVEQIKKMIHTRQLKYETGHPAKLPSSATPSQIMTRMMNDLVQYAMSFANDSMHTSLCLQFSPQQIATACIYLAGNFAHVQPTLTASSSSSSSNTTNDLDVSSTEGQNALLDAWAKVLGRPNMEAHASICLQIFELIYDRKASDSDSFKKIRAQIELWKQRAEETLDGAGDADGSSTTTAATTSNSNNKRSPPPPPPPPPSSSSSSKKPPPPGPPPGVPPSKRPRQS